MTMHFAPAIPHRNQAVAGALGAAVPAGAANDNDHGLCHDAIIKATLRHFANHGLSAARRACENAEAALQAGDHEDCRFWLSICRMLDRRMAAAISARVEAAG